MRVYEPQGKSAEIQLDFTVPLRGIYKVEGRPQEMSKMKHENGMFLYKFYPNEIAQFYLEGRG